MSTISLRLPDYLHKSARQLAKSEHISVNQLVASALAENIFALATEEYPDALAAHGSRDSFDRVMAMVKDRPPLPGDER
jgi:hypothetical protein